ncbi:MAG: hypothetical protein HOK74_04155 [Nitrosomonadales bacterium]|nr:hypothetical protein [Nitrosomonadales bacterium]
MTWINGINVSLIAKGSSLTSNRIRDKISALAMTPERATKDWYNGCRKYFREIYTAAPGRNTP